MSPYELAVGLRYTRARKGSGRNTFISFIALISMAGIALGVAALIVVLSVMNGFQHELRNRILVGRVAHRDPRRSRTSSDWQAVAEVARGESARRSAPAPYVPGRRCSRRATSIAARSLRGIDPAQRGQGRRHRRAHARRRARSLDARRASASCSAPSSRARSACGSATRVVAITPQGNDDAGRHAAAPQELHVVGVFEVGMFEFDSGLALINIDDAQKLYRLDGVERRAAQARRHVRGAARRARARRARCPSTPRCATGRAATRTSSARSRSRSA